MQIEEDYDLLNLENFNLTNSDVKTKVLYWKLVDKKWSEVKNQIGQKWVEKQYLTGNYKTTLLRLHNATTIVSNKVSDLNWKIFHGGLITQTLAKTFKISDGKCPICGQDETLDHAVFECKYVKEMWKKCKLYLVRKHSLNNGTDMKKMAIAGTDNDNNEISDINYCVTSYMKYTIWNIRNSVVFDKIDVTLQSYIMQLKCSLLSWINTLYFMYKMKNKTAEFTDRFSRLVRIEDHKCTFVSFL